MDFSVFEVRRRIDGFLTSNFHVLNLYISFIGPGVSIVLEARGKDGYNVFRYGAPGPQIPKGTLFKFFPGLKEGEWLTLHFGEMLLYNVVRYGKRYRWGVYKGFTSGRSLFNGIKRRLIAMGLVNNKMVKQYREDYFKIRLVIDLGLNVLDALDILRFLPRPRAISKRLYSFLARYGDSLNIPIKYLYSISLPLSRFNDELVVDYIQYNSRFGSDLNNWISGMVVNGDIVIGFVPNIRHDGVNVWSGDSWVLGSLMDMDNDGRFICRLVI